MKSLYKFFALWLIVFIASCSQVSVNYDYDEGADFNKLKTFKWLPFPEKEIAPSIVKKRIIKAVNYQLELKDFKKAEKTLIF